VAFLRKDVVVRHFQNQKFEAEAFEKAPFTLGGGPARGHLLPQSGIFGGFGRAAGFGDEAVGRAASRKVVCEKSVKPVRTFRLPGKVSWRNLKRVKVAAD